MSEDADEEFDTEERTQKIRTKNDHEIDGDNNSWVIQTTSTGSQPSSFLSSISPGLLDNGNTSSDKLFNSRANEPSSEFELEVDERFRGDHPRTDDEKHEKKEEEEDEKDEGEDVDDDDFYSLKAFDEIRQLTRYPLRILRDALRRYSQFINPRLAPAFYALDEDEFRLMFYLSRRQDTSSDGAHGGSALQSSSSLFGRSRFSQRASDLIVRNVFRRFGREDGRVDLLELFGGLAILCDGSKVSIFKTLESSRMCFHEIGDKNISVMHLCTHTYSLPACQSRVRLFIIGMETYYILSSRWLYKGDKTLRNRLKFLFSLFDFGKKGDIVEDEMTLLMWAVVSAFSRLGLVKMPSEEELEYAT